MAEPVTLRSLIERLEKAEGPNRELDAEIMFDLFAKPVGQKDDGGPSGYLWPEDNPSWSFGIRFPGKDRSWFSECRERIDGETLLIERDGAYVLMNALRIPALTASLDAIVALIEQELPGWGVSLALPSAQESVARCELAKPIMTLFGPGIGIRAQVSHASRKLALAACLAFLRAKLQEIENA